MSTAVWIVMWREPAMRAPRSGCWDAYSSRIAIRAGISDSAIAISLRPQPARERSATWKSEEAGMVAVMVSGPPVFAATKKRRIEVDASAVGFAEPGPE